MKKKMVKRLLAGTLGLAMLLSDVLGGGGLATVYAEEADSEVSAVSEEESVDSDDEDAASEDIAMGVSDSEDSSSSDDVDYTITVEGDSYNVIYVDYGESVTLEVAAESEAELTYQWSVEGNGVIEGATDASYVTDGITYRCYYSCTISNEQASYSVDFQIYVNTGMSAENGNAFYYSVDPGSAFCLSAEAVTVDEGYTLSYQWYRDWEYIEGATDVTYTTDAITSYTCYQCCVTDSCGTWMNLFFDLSIDTGLSVTDNDFVYYVSPGEEQTISAEYAIANEGVTLTYQWYRNGVLLDDETDMTCCTGELNSYTYYECRVSDGFGYTVYIYYYFYIENWISINDGSWDAYLDQDGNTILYVTASADIGTLTYTWYYNDEDDGYIELEGADYADGSGSSLELNGALVGDYYYCKISDDYGNDTTVFFYTRLDTGLSVTDNWFEYDVSPGEELTLSADCVTINDGYTLTYQWYENGQIVDGATDVTYATGENNKVTYYYCLVSDAYNNSVWIEYIVRIENGLTIDDWNYMAYMDENGSVQLYLTASADSGSLTYLWFYYDEDEEYIELQGTDYADGSGSTVEISGLSAGQYVNCYVSDEYGNSIGASFYVTVDTGFSVGETWFEYYATLGSTVTMSADGVTIDDGYELTYQWYCEWEEIEGATDATYTIENISASRTYQCRVADSYGNYEYLYCYVCIDNNLKLSSDTNYISVQVGDEMPDLTMYATADNGTLTYVWYSYDENDNYVELLRIENTEDRTTTLPAAYVTTAGYYYCSVSDEYGNGYQNSTEIYIDTGLSTPNSGNTDYIYVDYGETAVLDASCVTVDYDVALSYQWYKNWERMDGETNITLTTDAITSMVPYYCKVTDEYGNSVRMYYYVTVENHLEVSNDETVYVSYGEDVTLTVEVTADDLDGLYCSWSGNNYVDYNWCDYEETGTELTLTNVTAGGSYYCYVYDKYGAYQYAWFNVIVDTGLTSSTYDGSQDIAPNGTLTLETTAIVDEGFSLSYQWYEEWDILLEGETGSTLTISGLTEYTRYQCRVTDGCGNYLWFYYNISVDNELTVNGGGTWYVLSGEDCTFTVSASVLSGNISYEWGIYDDSDWSTEWIDGAAGTELTVTNITEDTIYRCFVEDEYGNYMSIYYYVYVTETLQLNAESTNYTIQPGESITLSVDPVTYNTDSLEYQWYLWKYDNYYGEVDYVAIDGATAREYVVNASDLSGDAYAYYYRCVVFDGEVTRQKTIYVTMDSGFTMISGDNIEWVELGSELEFTLTAQSDAADAEYTFRWELVTYTGDSDETAVYTTLTDGIATSGNSSTLTVTVNEEATYRCVCSDGYEMRNYYFYAYVDSGLAVTSGLDSYNQYIDVGETVTLSVNASTGTESGTLSYQWYCGRTGMIEGATESTYTTGMQDSYWCVVEDDYNSYNISYYVNVDSVFSVGAIEGDYVVESGESTVLSIWTSEEADSLTWQWFVHDDEANGYVEIEGATSDSLTITGGTAGDILNYKCTVSNGYRYTNRYQTVYVIGETAPDADSAVTLTEGTATVSVAEPDGLMYFKVTPSVSGTYIFYATEKGSTKAYLYDADMNKLKFNDGYDVEGRFRITYDLEAGKTYYLACGYYESYSYSIGSYEICMEREGAEAIDISAADVTLSSSSYTYDGNAKTPTVTITRNGTALTEDTDYTVSYSDNVNAGTATVTITGCGRYTGTIEKNYTIDKATQTITLSNTSVSVAVGGTSTVTAAASDGGTISWKSSSTSVATVSSGTIKGVAVGTATITVSAAATDNYNAATATVSVSVVPAAATLSSLTNASSGITVKWTKVTGATGYYIYRKAGSSGSWTKYKTITSGSTVSYTDTSVTSGTTYSYKVYAYASTGTAAASGSKSLIRLAAAKISSVANATSGITIKWGKITGASGYYIYRKAGSGSYSLAKTITSGSTVSYTDTAVKSKSGTTYTYYVIAYYKNSSGTITKGTYSNTKAIRRLSSATISSLTNTSSGITVKWSKITGASGYYVYRKAGSGSYSLAKTITSASTVSWSDTTVKSKNGTTYTYYVIPYYKNSSGTITKGSYVNTKKTVRLTGVSISSVTNSSSKKMTVKWAKNSKATGYQIQYSTSSSFASGNKTVTVTSASTVSKVISSLTKGKTYYVRIRVYKTVSGTKYYSAWSSKKSVKISK